MKIEKVNDNQIKLYLDKHDLEDRHMCLADIAYGSDFANEFFTQIIREVNLKTGFDTENVPLMVEAIPTGKDSLVLIVTRCDDPEELDTRFSRFTPSPNKYEKSLDENGEYMEIRKKTPRHAASNDEKLANLNAAAKRVSETPSGGSANDTPNLSREKINSLLFVFNSIQDVMEAAAKIQVHPSITSSLYKNLSDERFYLIVNYKHKDETERSRFIAVCSTLSEYSRVNRFPKNTPSFFDEHFEILIDNNAIEMLSSPQ